MTPGFFVPGSGFLYRLDPRPKMWVALLGILLCLLLSEITLLAGLLLAFHIILAAGGVSLRVLGRLWASLAVLLIVILVLQPIIASGDGLTMWQIGPVNITRLGLLTGLRYALRLAGAAFALAIAIATTPVNLLVRGLQKVGLPYTWALTVGIALRYLGMLGDLYSRISDAQQARGWDISEGGAIRRVRAAVPTLVALIVASLRLIDSLSLGLAARGFGFARQGQRPSRSILHDITFSASDWVTLVIATLSFAGVVALSLLLYR